MSRPTVINHNVATGEISEREMNNEEYAEWQTRVSESDAVKTAEAQKAAQRQAVLTKLGLTADELAAILS